MEKMGITCLKKIDESFVHEFYNWIFCKKPLRMDFSTSIPEALEYLFLIHEKIRAGRTTEPVAIT